MDAGAEVKLDGEFGKSDQGSYEKKKKEEKY